MTLARGDRLGLELERPAFGGALIGRAPDGRIVFARGIAAPGDRVQVELTRVRKRFLEGRVVEREAVGQGVQPFCPLAERCGGCPWQAVPAAAQAEALQAHVERALGVPAPMTQPEPRRAWRSTARVHWAGGRIGFHAAGGALVEVERCPALRPELQALLDALRAAELPGEGTARLTAAPGASSGTIALSSGSRAAAERLLGSPACHGVSIPGARLGQPWDDFGEARHPTGSFVQAHQPGNAALVRAAVALCEGRVLELFAGSGNFSLALVAAGHALTAVERDAAAVEALRAKGVEAVAGDAAQLPAGDFDTALVDPPRAGAARAIEVLHGRGLRRIVYVSCEPSTLARDVRWLEARGWRADRAATFDLFPHTGHVETLLRVIR